MSRADCGTNVAEMLSLLPSGSQATEFSCRAFGSAAALSLPAPRQKPSPIESAEKQLHTMRSIWLMYHDVFKTAPENDLPASAAMYHVSRDRFSRHLNTIRASGLAVRTAAEAIQDDAPPALVITFDDGWAGSFLQGLPLLESVGWRATIFVTRDFIGRPGFCTPGMISAASRAGMEIGVHGTTHRMLSGCTRAEILQEFTGCKEFLENLIRRPVVSASLPGGDLNATIIDCARAAGFVCLCSSVPGVHKRLSSRFKIKRMPIRSTTSDDQIARYCRFAVHSEVMRWAVLETPRRVLGMRNYVRVRRWLLDRRKDSRELWQP